MIWVITGGICVFIGVIALVVWAAGDAAGKADEEL